MNLDGINNSIHTINSYTQDHESTATLSLPNDTICAITQSSLEELYSQTANKELFHIVEIQDESGSKHYYSAEEAKSWLQTSFTNPQTNRRATKATLYKFDPPTEQERKNEEGKQEISRQMVFRKVSEAISQNTLDNLPVATISPASPSHDESEFSPYLIPRLRPGDQRERIRQIEHEHLQEIAERISESNNPEAKQRLLREWEVRFTIFNQLDQPTQNARRQNNGVQEDFPRVAPRKVPSPSIDASIDPAMPDVHPRRLTPAQNTGTPISRSTEADRPHTAYMPSPTPQPRASVTPQAGSECVIRQQVLGQQNETQKEKLEQEMSEDNKQIEKKRKTTESSKPDTSNSEKSTTKHQAKKHRSKEHMQE